MRFDAVGYALLLRSLTDDLVLLTGGAELQPSEVALLRSAGIAIRDDPVARVEGEHGRLARIIFADGSSEARSGLFLMPALTRTVFAADLGCELDDSGAVVVDADGRTTVAAVFAAGDLAIGKKSVVVAAAEGSRAAYALNADLASGLHAAAR